MIVGFGYFDEGHAALFQDIDRVLRTAALERQDTADLGAVTEVSVLLALLKIMGIGGLLFVWVTQTRINTANYYLAAVNLEALVQLFGKPPFGRIGWAIVVGAIVYLLMLIDVFSYLLQALAYQGIFVVAWVAVAMAHIFSSRYEQLVGSTIEYRSSHVPRICGGGQCRCGWKAMRSKLVF